MTNSAWPLIPAPAHASPLTGASLGPVPAGTRPEFTLSCVTGGEAAASRIAEVLGAGGWVPGTGGLAVRLGLDPSLAGRVPGRERPSPEAFELTVTNEAITLEAASLAGLHAGAGRLTQLLGPGRAVSPIRILDAPAYPWRGLSVDIARSFYGPATLRRLAGLAAVYGLNRLHLHLSDDQGWRLQLTCRPGLTAMSGLTASRGGAAGFLTQAEYRKLDAYCEARGITLVPEIDVPGHTNAALHALPELNPRGQAPAAYDGDDVGFSRLHLGEPATEPFLREVFAEVASLTRGPYVHVGGDEAMALRADEYRALVAIALAAVRDAGKQPVGWEEIAPAVTRAGTLVQYWFTKKRPKNLAAAVAKGARVILSPGNHTYLDMRYRAGYPGGQDWAGLIPVGQAGAWDPASLLAADGVPASAIEGVEAAIWTEFIHREDELLGFLLPRLAEVAEVAWTGAPVQPGTPARLAAHRELWQAMGLTIRWHEGAWPGDQDGQADHG